MFGRPGRLARTTQALLAWLGLDMVAASFAWGEWASSRTGTAFIRPPERHEPFSVVVLDPGHGGQDSGAIVGEAVEKNLTLDVAQRIDRMLQGEGMATMMTRSGYAYASLAERPALTNRIPDCIMVSIHFNEGNKKVASGIETYYADHQTTSGGPIVSWLPFLQ